MIAPLLAAFGPLARAALARLDAETAHHLAVAALARLPEPAAPPADPLLGLRLFGRDFPNPLGLAAGFDKNADVGEKLCALGFGFVEVGGVTPLPQPGNARPRVFRLSEDGAIINRYGLNSAGMAAVAARLAARRGVHRLGVNLGPNKDSADRVADFVALVGGLGRFADFVTINVSSPNTPGLRDLQGAAALDTLVARVLEARPAGFGGDAPVPVLLKIAPDLDLPGLDSIAHIALSRGVDGLIIANTTMGRPASLRSPARAETGGLSGRPVFALSTWVLAQAALRLEGRVPLVGVGGIDGPEAALAKIDAGASLVQLYSALVFEGPGLVGRILAGLRAAAQAEGGSLAPRIGRRAGEIAALGPEAAA